MSTTVRLATRGSPLARYQAELVAERLRDAAGVAVELVIVKTTGDRRVDVPISDFAERGAFTTDVETAVLEGGADAAVHSAKDLPTQNLAAGLILAAVPDRGDVRDVLVGKAMDDLATGATVASGAIRRRAQLAHLRPDLNFVELRGNIGTRLEKVPEGGSVVMALAALERLELAQHASEILSTSVMLPQVGQGAIAIRCREDDHQTLELVDHIDDEAAHRCLRAERAFLDRLGGGCDAPIGALARSDGVIGEITIEAMLAARDGSILVRRALRGSDPERIGAEVAALLLGTDQARAIGLLDES